ncbi:MAG: adenylyltransferase/cytidyltransferase family protein, partial [Streptococcaceae bacterium]|nr:adenylyltransferase/cytidyltransferase family protein [Streptococcaceae bacterium]
MKEIFIHHPYTKEQIPNEDVVLVLGYFDGVHLGHQEVIQRGREIAKRLGVKLALLTFNHHPSIVFDKPNIKTKMPLLSSKRKAEIIRNLGVDTYYVVDFTSQFSQLTPQEFVDQYIIGLHARVAVGGFDYTFGDPRVASIQNMSFYAKGKFEVEIVSVFKKNDQKVSSSKIRVLLDVGNVEEANKLLGYPYETTGIVVHGEARGRQIGYPTANLEWKGTVRLPKV